jgi:hypothetical protein
MDRSLNANWNAYMDLHNLPTPYDAIRHLVLAQENSDLAPITLKTVMRYYCVCGFTNQYYTNVDVLCVALVNGIDAIIMPPAVTRDSFENLFYLDRHGRDLDFPNVITWKGIPQQEFYDTSNIMGKLANYNIELILQDDLNLGFKKNNELNWIYNPYVPKQFDSSTVISIKLDRKHKMTFDDISNYIYSEENLDQICDQLITVTGDVIIMFDMRTPIFTTDPLCAKISAVRVKAIDILFDFNPALVGVANDISSKVKSYDSVHLRVEGDFIGHKNLNFNAMLRKYVSVLNPEKLYYISSGVFRTSYNTRVRTYLNSRNIKFVSKEDYIGDVCAYVEQYAIIDFLVMIKSDNFIGLHDSTFSELAHTIRCKDDLLIKCY